MVGVCLETKASDIVHTNKTEVDYNLWGVYQQNGGVSSGSGAWVFLNILRDKNMFSEHLWGAFSFTNTSHLGYSMIIPGA